MGITDEPQLCCFSRSLPCHNRNVDMQAGSGGYKCGAHALNQHFQLGGEAMWATINHIRTVCFSLLPSPKTTTKNVTACISRQTSHMLPKWWSTWQLTCFNFIIGFVLSCFLLGDFCNSLHIHVSCSHKRDDMEWLVAKTTHSDITCVD